MGTASAAEAALTETSCSNCESMSLSCLRSQITFFNEGSPPRSAFPFAFSPRPKKQRSSRPLTLGSSDVTPAQPPHAPLLQHRLISPVCLVSFGVSKEEIEEWVCSSLKAHAAHLSKPCRTTSASAKRAYAAASSVLHTMVVL